MKFGFICPHCNKEITYDDEYYDRKIAELGKEINEVIKQIQMIKEKPLKERKELKSYRKGANKMRDNYVFTAFKEIVKERYGANVYMEIIKEAENDIAATSTEELMTRGYSRKHGERVNKV